MWICVCIYAYMYIYACIYLYAYLFVNIWAAPWPSNFLKNEPDFPETIAMTRAMWFFYTMVGLKIRIERELVYLDSINQ